jgi:hypothetical protein
MSDRFGTIPIQPPESSPPDKKPGKRTSRAVVTRTSKARKPKKPSINRTWSLLAALVVLFALYCTFGFWGVPYYVTKILPEQFQEKTGMVLQPTAVTFNPFTFRFVTGEVQIHEPAAATPLLSLRSLAAKLAPVALLRWNLACTAVTVQELQLNIARETDGTYNFQRIVDVGQGGSSIAKMDFSALPVAFSLNNISIQNSGITFKDTPTGTTHTIEKMQLDVPTFANIPLEVDKYIRPYFSAIVNGSPVELTGKGRMVDSLGEEQATSLAMDIHDLDLTLYAGYLPFNLPIEVTKGLANGAVNLLFDPQTTGTDKLSIAFQLQLSEAELLHKKQGVTITVPTARLNGTLLINSRTIHFTEIAVKAPIVSSFGTSMPAKQAGVTPEGVAAPPAAAPVAGAPYTLVLDLLLVDNATMRMFAEKKSSRPTSTWNALELSVKDYRSALGKPGNPRIGHTGYFTLSGEKVGTPTHFSWQGNFSSPENISGNLTLLQIDGQDLFKAIAPTQPFTLEGIAELQGQFVVFFPAEQSSPMSYTLIDAEVTIENFSLMDKEKNTLTAPLVTLAPVNLAKDSVNFGNVQLRKADAQLRSDQIPEFFTSFATGKYRLRGIDFDGRVTITSDKKSGHQLRFTDVSCKANGLDSAKKTPDNLSIAGKTPAGGIFKAQGSVGLAPFSLTMKTGFRDLPAKNILSLFSTSSFLHNIEGNLNGKGLFTLPSTGFVGELQMTDFINKDAKVGPFSWQKAIFQNVNYTARPLHLGMSTTKIDHARFAWHITPDGKGPMHSLAEIFKKYLPQVDKKAADKANIAVSPIDIQEIFLTNSTIQLHDHRLSPVWQAEIADFAGKIGDIHSTPGSGKNVFSFTGKLDDTPFTIDGTMDALAEQDNGTFRFSLAKYPLASFHQQLTAQTDVDTGNGEFSLTLNSRWQEGKYRSSGNVVFTDVQPLDATSDSALPLALLTGDDNTFQLDFDYSRNQPVAKTTLFDEILTSFQKELIKSAVSPLLLATGDFTDLIGNEFVEFQPGEFMLTDKGRQVLIRYGALLIAHPHVGLALSDGVHPIIDRSAMKQRLTTMEQRRVEQENEKLFAQWREKKIRYEKNLAEQQKKMATAGNILEQDIPADVLARFTPIQPVPVVVDETMLLELRQKRINILAEYFTSQAASQPDQISIATLDHLPEKPQSSGPAVTIALTAITP